MQIYRSKFYDLYLVLLTLFMGIATPLLMLFRKRSWVRAYSLTWARAVSFGISNFIGLKYNVVGKLPSTDSPKLIISNHQSPWETIIFSFLFENVSFVVKKELGEIPIFGWYMKNFPMVLIDRSNGRAALKDLLKKGQEAVDEGRSILIFPEGTRLLPDQKKKFNPGVAALYSKLNIPAVTIAHNAGCFWNDDYAMKYDGEVTVKIIEQIEPGMSGSDFLKHIESSINEEKEQLKNSDTSEAWRLAVG